MMHLNELELNAAVSLGLIVPRAILAERNNGKPELLIVESDPRQAVWVDYGELKAAFPDILELYESQEFYPGDDLFSPCSTQMRENNLCYEFRLPQTDLYVEAPAPLKVDCKLKIQSFSFDPTEKAEEIAARALFAPPALSQNAEFYEAVKREFYPMQTPASLKYSAAWAVQLNIVELLKEFYKLRLMPVAIYGAHYFATARELERAGIISSRDCNDIANCFFLNATDAPPKQCNSIISLGIAGIETKCTRRLLVLEEPRFMKEYANFLGVASIEDFAFLELANLEQILSVKPNMRRLLAEHSLDETFSGVGSQAYVLRYNETFPEAVRTKRFLETDSCVARVFGEHLAKQEKVTIKSQASWLEMMVWILGNLLQNLWTYNNGISFIGERAALIGAFIDALRSSGIRLLTVVVPDCMQTLTEQYFTSKPGVQLFTELHEDTFLRFEDSKFKVILLTESQICAYFLLNRKLAGFIRTESLSTCILFPFTSTRNIEMYAQEVFFFTGAKTPTCYTIMCNRSIEEQLLVFREQLCHVTEGEMAGLESYFEGLTGSPVDVYNEMVEFIEKNGYDGNWKEERYDWKVHGISIETEDEFDWMYCFKWINRHNNNCQILQAASLDLFTINPNFNISVFASYLQNAKSTDPAIGHGTCQLELTDEASDQFELFYYEYNKNHDRTFRSAFELPNFEQPQKQICESVDKMLLLSQQTGHDPGSQLREYIENGERFGHTDVCYENIGEKVYPYVYMPLYKLPSASKYEFVTSISVESNNSSVNEEDGCVLSVGHVVRADVSELRFIENEELSVVSYRGGQRADQIIIKEQTEHLQHLELLAECVNKTRMEEEQMLGTFVAALGLIDKSRCYSMYGIYEGFNFELENFPPEYILNYVIQSLTNNVNKKGMFDLICYDQILLYVTPFELFLPMQMLIRRGISVNQHLLFNGSIYDFSERFIRKNMSYLNEMDEYVQFMLEQFSTMKIESLVHVYEIGHRFSFINNLIKAVKEQKSSAIKYTNKLLSTPVFYTKCIAMDSLLLQTSFSAPEQYYSGELADAKLKQTQLFENDASLYVLHRCFSQMLKNISCTSVYEFMASSEIASALKQFESRQLRGIQKLETTGFDLAYYYSGLVFPLCNKKLFSSEIVYNLSAVRERFEQQGQPNAQETNLHKNEREASEKRDPVSTGDQAAGEQDEQSAEKGTAQQTSDSSAIKAAPKLLADVSQLNVFSTSEAVRPSCIPSLEVNISFEQNYVDSIIQQASKDIFLMTMKRIMNHYSCRSYYFHKNLLYVPEVCIINSADAVKHQFGRPVTYLDHFETDKYFMSLLQILTNEFKRENDNKSPNIHKFCTVFNENIKKKLEMVSKYSNLQQGYYSSILVIYQWLLKRTLQAECDLNQNSLVVFKQDPVLGLDLDKCGADLMQGQDKYRFARHTDWVFETSDDDAVKARYEQYKAYLDQIPADYRNKQLLMLVKIGIGTGSTPLETFYRFIQKDDPFKVSKTLGYLTNLLVLCQQRGLEFPYRVPNITANEDEVAASIYRLEHMRFLHVKLQQFDFLQWLQRLQDFRSADMTRGEAEMIFSVAQRQMMCNTTHIFPDYERELAEHERQYVRQIGQVASELDSFNQMLWEIDIMFNEFVSESDPEYNMLKSFKLEKFAINDFDQSGIRQAWEVSAQFKLLFLALFGSSKAVVAQLINENENNAGEPLLDMKMVQYVFEQIQQLWSRLHDFILCHIITDMGYTEAMMQSVVGSDSRPKSKHVEFLRQGEFYAEEQLVFSVNALYNIFEKTRETLPDETAQQEIFPKIQHIGRMLGVKALRFPSPKQILTAIQFLRKISPKEILETQPVAKELLTRRVEKIALALRCERILVCDPLQKYLVDKSVSLLPPAAKPVRILTCPSLCDNDAGGFQVQLNSIIKVDQVSELKTQDTGKTRERDQPSITASQGGKSIQISHFPPPPLKITPWSASSKQNSAFKSIHESVTSPITNAPNFIAGQPFLVPNVPPEVIQQRILPPKEPEPQPKAFSLSVVLPSKTELFIENTKLSFYKDKESEVIDEIYDFLSKVQPRDLEIIKQDLDGFLFHMSTCEAFKMDIWGRMYSWLCNYILSDIGMIKQAQENYLCQIYQFAQQFILVESTAHLFQYIQQLYAAKSTEVTMLEPNIRGFLEATLDLAYAQAHELRDYIINNPASDLSVRRRAIAVELWILTCCGEECLMQFLALNANKRKFALCNFLCTCLNVE